MNFIPNFLYSKGSFIPLVGYLSGNATPIQKLFCLNTSPKQPNSRYVILANGIINANHIIIDK